MAGRIRNQAELARHISGRAELAGHISGRAELAGHISGRADHASRLKISMYRGSAVRVSSSRGRSDVNGDVVDHPAGPEQQNAVGETDGFTEVVGYEDDRPTYLGLPKLEEFSLYFDSGLRIEGGKRFVHQQDVRIQSPRSGQRDTLAHPLGEVAKSHSP